MQEEDNEYQPGIELTDDSIEEIKRLCSAIKRKAHNNEMSVERAVGIANYAETHEFLSAKQAEWCARNADIWKLPRPAALAHVKVPKAAKKPPVKAMETASDFDDPDFGFHEAVIASFITLIELFESHRKCFALRS